MALPNRGRGVCVRGVGPGSWKQVQETSGDMCKKPVFLFLILIASCSVEPDFDASDFP